MTDYVGILVRRAKRWEELLGKKQDVFALRKSAKLERFVHKGIPMKYRGSVWMVISGAKAKRDQEPELYLKLIGQRVKPKDVSIEQVKIAFHINDHPSFFLSFLTRLQPTFQELFQQTFSSGEMTQKVWNNPFSTCSWPLQITIRKLAIAKGLITSLDCYFW